MAMLAERDDSAHTRPPQAIRDIYKRLQKTPLSQMPDHSTPNPIQETLIPSLEPSLSAGPRAIFNAFTGESSDNAPTRLPGPESCEVPGLLIYRSLLPPEVQLLLLEKIFHRDLANPEHLTNVHLHYDVPYPPPGASYFDTSSADLHFQPQDPSVHKPFDTRPYLSKKLRWMTLGGQYDWTSKEYPTEVPPPFPPDMAKLIGDLFSMTPEAAIVNLYSPGDTLSLHRDVSEECNRPLVSASLGCDGIFLIGLEGATETDEPRVATLRLRSGDAVVMAGESRYAWHGVPKVIAGTCPDWMEAWPCAGEDAERFEAWKGWMKAKRINLNVRQMFA